MIFDDTNMFSDQQAITATAGSTNTIDLGPIKSGMTRDIGKGTPIPLLIQVTETFDTAAEDGTLTITIEEDSTDTFTPDQTTTVGVFTEAQLIAGFQTPYQYVPKGIDMRYIRLKYTVGGAGNFTAGKITAGIVMGVQTNG